MVGVGAVSDEDLRLEEGQQTTWQACRRATVCERGRYFPESAWFHNKETAPNKDDNFIVYPTQG